MAFDVRVLHVDTSREFRGGQRQLSHLVAHADADVHQVAARDPFAQDAALQARGCVRAVDGPLALARLNAAFRPDVLHAHDPRALGWALAVGRIARVPVVAHRRVDFQPSRLGIWKYRLANRVIAVSQAIADLLTVRGVEAGRVDVVRDAVAVPRIARRPVRDRVIAVGALVDHKDHATLIDAWPAVRAARPGATLTILGDGPLRGALLRRCFARGVADSVTFEGFVADLSPWWTGAAVLVHPSRAEGAGGAVLEAQAAGVPVVGTRVGGLAELLAEGRGLTAPPGDPGALARAMLDALVEGPATAARVERAQAFAARCSPAALAQETRRCWLAALAGDYRRR